MHRSVPLVLALLLLPILAASAGGSSPPPNDIWTVHTAVRATVAGNFATVQVIADISNDGPDPEFPFQVRVPDDALVTGLTIERDGEVHVARIAGREEARQQYEEWKAQEQTGGLIEKTRRSNVYAYLINVANFTSVRATLTYEQYLAADRGVYNLSVEAPVSGFGRDLGASFEARIFDADNAWASPTGQAQRESEGWSVTHSVGPRPDDASTPWQASYTLDPTAAGGSLVTTIHNGTGYFAHRFRAAPDVAQLPLDLVLVLDTSGSMSGLKIEQMRDAAAQVVRMLGPEDRLHLAPFSSDVVAPWAGFRGMTATNRATAADEVNALLAAGGTNIGAGLQRALDTLAGTSALDRETRMQVVVLLGDGQPTAGETNRDALVSMAGDVAARGAILSSIAFGHDADWPLTFQLAAEGGGVALRVPEGAGAEVDIRRFLAGLTTPVLKDVAVEYGEGVVARNTGADVLLAGSELLIVGTFDPDIGISGTVRATGPDGARANAFAGGQSTSASWLPRLVAYHEVRHLQDVIDTQGDPTGELSREIVRIAVEHGFVTDHTSLVLTLPAREMTAANDPRFVASTTSHDAAGRSSAPVYYGVTPTTAPTTLADRAFHVNELQGESAPAQGETSSTPPGGTTPEAEVPAAGALLVLAALGVVALALRRRK